MKLVIGGSTGFVGAELIRQGLENPAITSIVALGRRETPPPARGHKAEVGRLRQL
jgi:precorrin isomerase